MDKRRRNGSDSARRESRYFGFSQESCGKAGNGKTDSGDEHSTKRSAALKVNGGFLVNNEGCDHAPR
jgi:hypothetical protein